MLIPILLLLSLSCVVIYTSSPSLAIQQFTFSIIGIICFFILRNIDFRNLGRLVKPLYILIISLLILTLFLGFETRGSIRWIPLGFFNLQPSELAKPIIILILSFFWTKNMPSWKNIFKSLLIVFPIFVLVFRQPDLGTTLTLGFIWFILLIAANLSFFKLTILSIFMILITPLTWFSLQEYQKQRIFSFLSPTKDPQGIGFHVIQSTIAVGSGGLLGRGLGRGTQSRLQFLPEFRTDFIFAFIAEELGFLGSLIVIVLYLVIFLMTIRLLYKVGDRFGELIIIGVMAMMFFQIFVNIGMNIGVLPITGITLPLLSYGGSSIVTTLICLGLISSVSRFGLKQKEVPIFSLN